MVNLPALLRTYIESGGAGYRQRRVEMLVNKSTSSRISSLLAKSYVDGAGKDFGDVSIQA